MKKYTLFFLCALGAHLGYGQQTEVSFHLNSGAANFRGSAAAANSSIVLPHQAGTGPYTSNVYGSRLTFSYGVAGQVQRLAASQTLLGVQAGYEQLRSRVQLVSVVDRTNMVVPVDGKTILTNSFATVHPFFGRRFRLSELQLDLTAGPELGLLLHSQEEGQAQSPAGGRYSSSHGHDAPDFDLRGRLNLTAYYQKVGLSVGYSYGVTNYRESELGTTEEAYSQVFRAGLAFRLAEL
ncbi:hypothetical protein [Hymenobacter chitinivorans]|uniref:Outer membrane protein with beta-barrel domain n=1 Tax=Hymenobacter chitinivorans DSM 11115 TaxID=1121954 RepID=A0A2M9AQU9_9BACT|nr:hypothetical protein [Hymenobacter chitinivorans]PJJ48062.1 hypothetical protein CLV45_4755 [Hymenobacter chitinivorans DSM 11115]